MWYCFIRLIPKKRRTIFTKFISNKFKEIFFIVFDSLKKMILYPSPLNVGMWLERLIKQ